MTLSHNLLSQVIRHKLYPTLGRSVPYKYMTKGLAVMRQHNTNANRT